MDWNFTLSATASGLINNAVPFEDAAITIELSACRFATDSSSNRHYAIFNGNGIVRSASPSTRTAMAYSSNANVRPMASGCPSLSAPSTRR